MGIRLRFQPRDPKELFQDYLLQRKAARDTVKAAEGKPGQSLSCGQSTCGPI
jgi:hypothetical protein